MKSEESFWISYVPPFTPFCSTVSKLTYAASSARWRTQLGKWSRTPSTWVYYHLNQSSSDYLWSYIVYPHQMHYCRRRPLHHNVTICENAHIRCSYLNILLTCQTVISWHTCSIKTLISLRRNGYSYTATYQAMSLSLLIYTVSQKNCASVVFWITPWNIGRFK